MFLNKLSFSHNIGTSLSINFAYWCFVGVVSIGLAVLAFRQQKEKITHS